MKFKKTFMVIKTSIGFFERNKTNENKQRKGKQSQTKKINLVTIKETKRKEIKKLFVQ